MTVIPFPTPPTTDACDCTFCRGRAIAANLDQLAQADSLLISTADIAEAAAELSRWFADDFGPYVRHAEHVLAEYEERHK